MCHVASGPSTASVDPIRNDQPNESSTTSESTRETVPTGSRTGTTKKSLP
jgi:hypothetical protein